MKWKYLTCLPCFVVSTGRCTISHWYDAKRQKKVKDCRLYVGAIGYLLAETTRIRMAEDSKVHQFASLVFLELRAHSGTGDNCARHWGNGEHTRVSPWEGVPFPAGGCTDTQTLAAPFSWQREAVPGAASARCLFTRHTISYQFALWSRQ